MREQQKFWANESRLDGNIVNVLYADLVKYFINQALKYFNINAKN